MQHPYAWLWNIGGVVAPYRLELVMTSGDRYFFHSPVETGEPAHRDVGDIRFWDVTSLDDKPELRESVKRDSAASPLLANPEQFIQSHPGLRFGFVSLCLDCIHHVVS